MGEQAKVGEERPYLDETKSQHSADMAVLLDNISRARMELSVAKINYFMTKAEVAGLAFDNRQVRGSIETKLATLRREIAMKRSAVDALHAMVNDIADGDPIPEPEPEPEPRLQIARRQVAPQHR